MAQNPYEVLGIKTDMGLEAIKKAYRRLIRQYHPDTGNGDADAFRKIQEAYELLSDPVKRRKYDAVRKMLEDKPKPSPLSGSPGLGWMFGSGNAKTSTNTYRVSMSTQRSIVISMSLPAHHPSLIALQSLNPGDQLCISSSGLLGTGKSFGGKPFGTVTHLRFNPTGPAMIAIDLGVIISGLPYQDLLDALKRMGTHYSNVSIQTPAYP